MLLLFDMWKVFFAFCLMSVPSLVLAAGLVPCGGPGEEPCQTCHVVQLVIKVAEWLVIVLGIVAALMIVVAGFRLVLSVGDASAKASAKRTIANMFIGYVIVLAAWLLIDAGLKTLLNSSTYGVWNATQCVAQPVTKP